MFSQPEEREHLIMKKERAKMKDQLNILTRPQLIALIVQKGVGGYSDAIQMTKTELVDVILTECDGDVFRPTPAS
jgi:hypothetical protein